MTVDFTVGIDSLSFAVRTDNQDAIYDLNRDSLVSDEDRVYWVKDLQRTFFGDANLDGEFDSGDLIEVFQAGEYEDGVAGNSVWATGDWSGDGEFDTTDLVAAFQDGGYELGPQPPAVSVPEPATIALILAGWAMISVTSVGARRKTQV